jgi:hypothetical protein
VFLLADDASEEDITKLKEIINSIAGEMIAEEIFNAAKDREKPAAIVVRVIAKRGDITDKALREIQFQMPSYYRSIIKKDELRSWVLEKVDEKIKKATEKLQEAAKHEALVDLDYWRITISFYTKLNKLVNDYVSCKYTESEFLYSKSRLENEYKELLLAHKNREIEKFKKDLTDRSNKPALLNEHAKDINLIHDNIEDVEKREKYEVGLKELKAQAKREKWTRSQLRTARAGLRESIYGPQARGLTRMLNADFRKGYVTKRILKSRLPMQKSWLSQHIEQMIKSLIPVVIGMAFSAMVGSVLLLIGFLMLGAYYAFPKRQNPIDKMINDVRATWQPRINALEEQRNKATDENAKRSAQDTINNYYRSMNQEIEARVGGMARAIVGAGAMVTFRMVFRFLFFVLFALGFITSSIPLGKPLGLLLAFIFYFTVREGT